VAGENLGSNSQKYFGVEDLSMALRHEILRTTVIGGLANSLQILREGNSR